MKIIQSIKRYLLLIMGDKISYKNYSHYRYLQKKRKNKSKYVLIASLPKSGSTYISKTFADIVGYKYDTFVSSFGRNEQDFFEPRLIEEFGKGFVIHQHLRASDFHSELITKYNIKVIILTRNIYDIIVSFYDHLHNETPVWFMVYISDDFFNHSDENKLNLIIDFLVPWIVTFYVSWWYIEKNQSLNIKWITYEEFFSDDQLSLKGILQYLELNESVKNFNYSEKNTKNKRFNIGKKGRGLKILNSNQIKRIKAFTKHYPSVDFSRIGL